MSITPTDRTAIDTHTLYIHAPRLLRRQRPEDRPLREGRHRVVEGDARARWELHAGEEEEGQVGHLAWHGHLGDALGPGGVHGPGLMDGFGVV